jgi:putative peptidoglycan lipid II flippase
MLLAERFGISPALDAFNIAYALPGIVGLISAGAVNGALVPLYLEWKRRLSVEEADRQALSLMLLLALFFGLTAAACSLLSPLLMPLIGYGFDPVQMRLGITMERFLAFLIVIEGVGISFIGILQAEKRFQQIQISPLFINLTIILLLLSYRALGIFTLVWGFLLGAFFRVLYLGGMLHRGGFGFRAAPIDGAELSRFLYLALPMLGSQLIANMNLMVDQVMATDLAPGSVSALRYAYRLNDMPIQIVIMAVTAAIFPFISERALENDREGLAHIFKQSVIFLGFLTLPVICLVALFSNELVAILFERGAFDPEATHRTAGAFLFTVSAFFSWPIHS